MIRNIFAGAAMLALGACATAGQTIASNAAVFPPAGPVSDAAVRDPNAYAAAFAEETRSAQTIIDNQGFSARCAADGRHWVFRVGNREVTTPFECSELTYVPMLVRRKVTSDDSGLLMIIGSGMGVLSDGVIIRQDDDARAPLVAIPIENMWMFGQLPAENRIVLITGEISPTGCGLIRHDRELTIDWSRGRIVSEREIPSPPLTCEEQSAN